MYTFTGSNMIKKIIFIFVAIVILAILLLSSCNTSRNQRSLENELKQIKISAASEQKQSRQIRYQLPAPMTYPPNSNIGSYASKILNSSNPLENYPLRSLRFTGTLTDNGQIAAYILTPDDMIYQVKVGDTVGNEAGKVLKITPDELDIAVKLVSSNQSVTEKIVSLQLKE